MTDPLQVAEPELDAQKTDFQEQAEEVLEDLADQQDSSLVWWAALVGPAIATLLLLGVVYITGGEKGASLVSAYVSGALAAFFVFGRFVILLGSGTADEAGYTFVKLLTPYHLFVMLTWMDMVVAVFVAFHMGVLFRIPWAGDKLKGLVSDGQFVLAKQPWIRRSAFLGLVFFVIFPTSTTGSIGGTIFGRLLGMKRLQVLNAILLGSLLGNGLMWMGASFFNRYFNSDSIYLKLGGVVLICVALFFFERKIRSLKSQYMEEEAGKNPSTALPQED